MTYSLTWLPTVLRAAGLIVIEEQRWTTRGHGDMGAPKGVLCHHTAGPLHGDSPSLPTVISGRPDLPGPLAQLFLSRAGTWHVVAAGKAYHAGKGGNGWKAYDGNSHLIGIEAENTGQVGGVHDDPWPAHQTEAFARGCAAILLHIGATSQMCLGHKEYAPARKIDPSFDMAAFRHAVDGYLTAPPTKV